VSERLKILLSGMVAGDPHQGGASWAVLQYLAGLTALGHEVFLVEPVAEDKLDPAGETARYFRSLSLPEDRAALVAVGAGRTLGPSFAELRRFAEEADLLLNVSGMLREEQLLDPIAVRAFLDLDPGFNQAWAASGEDIGIALHTHCVTVGQSLGRPDCPIPTCGRDWIATLPPVALDRWPVAQEAPAWEAFTSVGHWRSYGSIEHEGVRYGQRAHSLRGLIELPRASDASFRLALGIHPDESRDLAALRANGWELLDPRQVASSPEAYADFIRGSMAELSVAKSGYVASRSGWFSDRSACYLASGRPVVAQETGFGAFLPTGEGLLAFTTTAEAADASRKVMSDPKRHGAAARVLAEEFFDARKVLPRLLERLSGPAS
jgi:hypothetical protein